MSISPCKDCTLRRPACHDVCGCYMTWREGYMKARDERYKEFMSYPAESMKRIGTYKLKQKKRDLYKV